MCKQSEIGAMPEEKGDRALSLLSSQNVGVLGVAIVVRDGLIPPIPSSREFEVHLRCQSVHIDDARRQVSTRA